MTMIRRILLRCLKPVSAVLAGVVTLLLVGLAPCLPNQSAGAAAPPTNCVDSYCAAITSSLNPSKVGQSVTFTIKTSDPYPQGIGLFYVVNPNTVPPTNGSASSYFSTSPTSCLNLPYTQVAGDPNGLINQSSCTVTFPQSGSFQFFATVDYDLSSPLNTPFITQVVGATGTSLAAIG